MSERPIDNFEVSPAPREASLDVGVSHIVSALANAGSDPTAGKAYGGQTEKDNLYVESRLPHPFKPANVAEPGQRALECEVGPCFRETVNLRDHEASGRNRCGTRIEGRKPSGDQISIYEVPDSCVIRKVGAGEGCLASTIGAGYYETSWAALSVGHGVRLAEVDVADGQGVDRPMQSTGSL